MIQIRIKDIGRVIAFKEYGEIKRGMIIRVNRQIKLCKVIVVPMRPIKMDRDIWEAHELTVQWKDIQKFCVVGG